MLGKGRPFVIEVGNAHKAKFTQENIFDLQRRINESTSDISIRDLQIVPKEKVLQLKEGEETKKKTYSCIVWLSREVTEEVLQTIRQRETFVVQQTTPVRVFHR